MEMMDLPYHCPRLRADYLLPPCEKNLARVKTLKNLPKRGWNRGETVHLGPLEHCLECQGQELVIREAEELMQEQAEVSASRPENIAVTAVKGQYCVNCVGVEAHKNKHGRFMGLCLNCLRERAARTNRKRWRNKPVPPEVLEIRTKEEEKDIPSKARLTVKDVDGPMCKHHPDSPAVIDRLGRETWGFASIVWQRGGGALANWRIPKGPRLLR